MSAAVQIGSYANEVAELNSIVEDFCSGLEGIIMRLEANAPSSAELLRRKLMLRELSQAEEIIVGSYLL